jgi:hypothetical protein
MGLMSMTSKIVGPKLALLLAHEWAYKEGLSHVHCVTCRKQYTAARFDSGAKLPHREGCGYAALIKENTK